MDNNKARELAAALREHNAWRRGEGKYDGEPSVEPMPHTPKQLGEIIDQAATALETYAQEAAKWGKLVSRANFMKDCLEQWECGNGDSDATGSALRLYEDALARAEKMGV